jgi:hypothetical protein
MLRPVRIGFLPIFTLLLTAIGCGSSSSGPAPKPKPAPQAASFFSPVPPPLSPDTAWHHNSSASAMAQMNGRAALAAAQGALPMNAYFYVVNGVMQNGAPLPTGLGAPAPASAPLVLTVNGPAPNGAPNPNGGNTVELAPINANSTAAQLWKAVAAPNSNYFYLRSAESFSASTVNPGTFNMLVGYSATAVPLDLGFPSGLPTAIYRNQKSPPNGVDQSDFQQWIYAPATAQLSNFNGGQLYNNSSTASVGSNTSAPGNQWYTYPNYFLGRVVEEPDSDPPFPAFTGGQGAAYDYISNLPLINVPALSCDYEGTPYTGIRCEYSNLSTPAALTSCVAAIVQASINPPTSYNGTTISASDWSTVTSQVESECNFAVAVQNLFNSFNQILTVVFQNDSDQITPLAADVGLSASQHLNVEVIEILEGMVYTGLNATGNIGAGAFANLMETAVNVALTASGGGTLNEQLETTVGTLYTDLGNQFQQVSAGAGEAETAILEDWGRLSQIGPATNYTGYNGLGLTSSEITSIENTAITGYKLTVMQQLMPVASPMLEEFSNLGAPSAWPPANYNNYTYPTYGSYPTSGSNSSPPNNNSGKFQNNPDLKVMQTDIFGNGANPFQVFNAINGWDGLNVNFSTDEHCSIVAITLLNDTAEDFSVDLTPSEGTIAYPGCSQVSCEQGFNGFELRPYGYLPLYAGANTDRFHLQVVANINGAGLFNVSADNMCGDSATISALVTDSSSAFGFYYGAKPGGNLTDGGAWVTITTPYFNPGGSHLATETR